MSHKIHLTSKQFDNNKNNLIIVKEIHAIEIDSDIDTQWDAVASKRFDSSVNKSTKNTRVALGKSEDLRLSGPFDCQRAELNSQWCRDQEHNSSISRNEPSVSNSWIFDSLATNVFEGNSYKCEYCEFYCYSLFVLTLHQQDLHGLEASHSTSRSGLKNRREFVSANGMF